RKRNKHINKPQKEGGKMTEKEIKTIEELEKKYSADINEIKRMINLEDYTWHEAFCLIPWVYDEVQNIPSDEVKKLYAKAEEEQKKNRPGKMTKDEYKQHLRKIIGWIYHRNYIYSVYEITKDYGEWKDSFDKILRETRWRRKDQVTSELLVKKLVGDWIVNNWYINLEYILRESAEYIGVKYDEVINIITEKVVEEEAKIGNDLHKLAKKAMARFKKNLGWTIGKTMEVEVDEFLKTSSNTDVLENESDNLIYTLPQMSSRIKEIMEKYSEVTIFVRNIKYPDVKLDVQSLEVKPEEHSHRWGGNYENYISESKIPDDKIPSCYLELRDYSYRSMNWDYRGEEDINVILLSGEWLMGCSESKSRGLGVSHDFSMWWYRNLLISPTGAAIVIYHNYYEGAESTTDEGEVVLHVVENGRHYEKVLMKYSECIENVS
ncbi:MAG: hypothetical protein N3A54_07195, partial [Patescibacteria group bacterium]|nr:hypothetical protein [Patescibacteria group bacterium]